MSFTLKYNNGTIFDPINFRNASNLTAENIVCLLYTSPSPRDRG